MHDRVQEAAYSLVSEEQRAPAHLRIGRLLARQVEPDQHEEAVFEIVGHFNRAAALLTSEEERDQVAALNLVAGKRAKKAAAVRLGAQLSDRRFSPDGQGWLAATARSGVRAGASSSRVRVPERRHSRPRSSASRILSSRAATVVERCAVACLVADVSWPLQRPDRGLAECLECLRHAGLEIPMHPTKAQAQAAYDQICSKLDGVGIDELAELPLLTDPTSRAILDVVAKVAPTAMITDMNLVSLLICAAVDLRLERGHCDSSCFAYEFLGYIAGWHFGDFERGCSLRSAGA